MTTIGIIEVKEISHMVWESCLMAMGEGRRVILFTNAEYADRIRSELGDDADKIEFRLRGKREPLWSYLRRVTLICDAEVDLVLINTLRSSWFAFFSPNCPVAARIYNTNWWCRDLYSLSSYFRNLCNLWSLLVPAPIYNAWTSVLVRRVILRRVDGVILEYEPLVKRVASLHRFIKPAFFFPCRFYRDGRASVIKDRFTLVVPGKIHSIRRDYLSVLRALSLLPDRDLAQCRLILLGAPKGRYGKRIVSAFGTLETRGLEVDCPSGFVPSEVFNQKMAESDMILAPLRPKFTDGTTREVFTHTKGTGSFCDALSFALPSLVPEFYRVADEVSGAFVKYRSPGHLCELIHGFINAPESVKLLRESAESLFSKYSLSRFQRNFHDMLRRLNIVG